MYQRIRGLGGFAERESERHIKDLKYDKKKTLSHGTSPSPTNARHT
jgi:hypothetical protein